jgi:hypothetical protein
MQSEVEDIESDQALYEEANFCGRARAMDHIEFNVVDRIEGLAPAGTRPGALAALRDHARSVQLRLEGVDDDLFERLRSEIRSGDLRGRALRDLIDAFVRRDSSSCRLQFGTGYDDLDAFISGLLLTEPVPDEVTPSEPEMVYYQPTQARIILDLAEKAHLTREDVFYDLGSGLGQVPILVHLLTGARTRGVEVETAYWEYARSCASDLGLPGVEFVNADARAADYSDGTVFFMFTPFKRGLLQDVLEKLRTSSQGRTIRLFTYGPCTLTVVEQPWLRRLDTNGYDIYELGVFENL